MAKSIYLIGGSTRPGQKAGFQKGRDAPLPTATIHGCVVGYYALHTRRTPWRPFRLLGVYPVDDF